MLIPFDGRCPQVEATAYIAPTATLVGSVAVGPDSSVWFGAVLRGDLTAITLGTGSNVQDNSVLHVTRTLGVTIGDEVTIGHSVTLHGCVVGHRCLIGMGATVLDGVEIGEGSIIAAGAVVPEGMIVPPRSLVMGVPGKVRRAVTDEELQAVIANGAAYVAELKRYRAALG